MHYTRQYVHAALRGLAADRPHQINPTSTSSHGTPQCAYDKDDQHCIAGQFFVNEGLDRHLPLGFAPHEGGGASVVCDAITEGSGGTITFDQEASGLLCIFQSTADNGQSAPDEEGVFQWTIDPREWSDVAAIILYDEANQNELWGE